MISKTRLLVLVQGFQWKAIEAGLRENPGLNDIRDKQGRNWLHLCAGVNIRKRKSNAADSIRTAEVLLSAGLDINEPATTQGKWKATPLWYAIAWGENLALAKYLLDHGSNPNHCLWAAVNRNNAAAIRLLIQNGAEDPTTREASPLLTAIQWNKFAAAEELLKLGANVNFQGPKKMTALHCLLKKNGDAKHIRMLISYGARGDIKDANGVTAIEIMKRKRDPKLRALAAKLLAQSRMPL